MIPGLPADVRAALELASRRLNGDYEEDEWGVDPEFAELAQPLLDFLYDRWWRVQAEGIEHVPVEGPALFVANHAGVLPWDATMLATYVRRAHPAERRLRFLVLNWAFELPFASVAVRKIGGVPASPANAVELLEQGHLVSVMPEGVKGVGKPYGQRYRLERFGRGGFVETALRTGAPIVPCAIVGSEEIYPKLAESRLLAKLFGAPYIPITPTFPLLGPLGFVPLPSRWRIEISEPIDLSAYGPEAIDDRGLVLQIAETVRERIQSRVFDNLVKRERTWL